MARLLLQGGAYQNKSVIAANQAAINIYPEINPEASQSPVPVTHYQTPGLDLLIGGIALSTVRCTYTSSKGVLYTVIGQTVFLVDSGWSLTALGSVGSGSTPVSMADNGLVIIIVDNTSMGYAINMATNQYGTISSNFFFGGTTVKYINTYFVFNQPNTNIFYSSLATLSGLVVQVDFATLIAGTAFQSGFFAAKSGSPDNIMTLAVIQGYVWLIGEYTTEIWYFAGPTTETAFPFALYPGINIIEHGTVAPYSVAAQDVFPYWISQDRQGQGIIVKAENYASKRISTHAIENELMSYPTIADCITYIYQQEGHTFVVFNFPTANKTWVFDEATEQWHQRAWTDNNGVLNRHRGNCCANAYGQIVVGDWQNGNLYAFDLNTFTDNGQPISRIRTFPHSIDQGNRVAYHQFMADMAVGNDTGLIDGTTPSNPPMVSLRYSVDRGVSYGNRLERSLGAAGQYLTNIQWQRLGLARDMVFELSWSAPCDTALNGAWIEFTPSRT